MRIILSRTVIAIAVLLSAGSGFAQSAYVSAAVGMDVSRFSGVESTGFDALQPGGEAAAFSLRLGTRVGRNWGVELAFTRPSEVENESTLNYPIPVARFALGIDALPPGVLPSIVPFPEITNRVERRNSTLETVAWIAQQVSDEVGLIYLGGIGFTRTVEQVSFEVTNRVFPAIIFPNSVRTTAYGVSPVVGVEARIELTDHARLVPGLRLQSIGGGNTGATGWLLRPSAGLMWEF